MRIIIKNPTEEVTLELRKLLKDIDSAPASWNEINHMTVDLKHGYFVTYTCNPVHFEYEYILNIDTIWKLHQVIAWYTVGMIFEDVKHALESMI